MYEHLSFRSSFWVQHLPEISFLLVLSASVSIVTQRYEAISNIFSSLNFWIPSDLSIPFSEVGKLPTAPSSYFPFWTFVNLKDASRLSQNRCAPNDLYREFSRQCSHARNLRLMVLLDLTVAGIYSSSRVHTIKRKRMDCSVHYKDYVRCKKPVCNHQQNWQPLTLQKKLILLSSEK